MGMDSGAGLRFTWVLVVDSHEDPEIRELYGEFLGRPLGEKPHRLLHTRYTPRRRT